MGSDFKNVRYLNIASSPKVLVLVDSRLGNANQALALAAKLGIRYQVKNLRYNNFAKLPNFLLRFWPIHIKKSILKELSSREMPDIIISSGRRTASLAIYLKKLSGNTAKIIQIMRPGLDSKKFDLIILPQHDSYDSRLSNVVTVIGALNNVQAFMPEARSSFRNDYPDMKNFIAVIVGGSSNKHKFTIREAELLSDTIFNVSQNHSLPLFISFSRRTPLQVKKLFRKRFLQPHVIYDPEEIMPNPYPAIIGEAEYIITTADSVSMCSEAASTGKPIYIFCPPSFKLKKHRFFVHQLIDLDIARLLEPDIEFLEKYDYEPLDEADRIVEIIKDQFTNILEISKDSA